MRGMPILETEQLIIRPFKKDEFDDVRRLFDEEIDPPGMPAEIRAKWLTWVSSNSRGLEIVGQPPYGDRAVTLKDGTLIGSVGLVPEVCRLPVEGLDGKGAYSQAEVALYWAFAPAHRRKGYATEAAGALIEHMFTVERLWRIIATTAEENIASQGVMLKLGMRLEWIENPTPAWMRVVGVLENKS